MQVGLANGMATIYMSHTAVCRERVVTPGTKYLTELPLGGATSYYERDERGRVCAPDDGVNATSGQILD